MLSSKATRIGAIDLRCRLTGRSRFLLRYAKKQINRRGSSCTLVCLNTECQEDIGFFFLVVRFILSNCSIEKKKFDSRFDKKVNSQGRLPRGSFPRRPSTTQVLPSSERFCVSWEESVWRNTRTVSISDDFEGNPHALVLWPVVSSPQDQLFGMSQHDRRANFPFKKHPSKHDQSNHRREDQHEPLR